MKHKYKVIIGLSLMVGFMFIHPVTCIGFIIGFVMGIEHNHS